MKKYHVFSDKIIEISKTLNCCPEEEFTQLTIAYNNIKDKLLYSSISVTINSCFLEIGEERMYEYLLQYKDLANVIYWINKSILTQLDILESKTLEVRLRIATSMLNKVIQENNINKLVGVIIHDNFTKNLRQLYFDLKMDELPF